MRTLALVTDAYGGHGGIAQYNRHFLTALAQSAGCEEVVALPRLVVSPEEPLPARLKWLRGGLGGRTRYFLALIWLLVTDRRYDIVYCGHINLLPVAALARWLTGARLILQVHGVDVWRGARNAWIDYLTERVDLCLAVSRLTRRRFLASTNLAPHQCRVLSNTIPDGVFIPGPKNPQLLDRYGLRGKKVLMTLGRLSKAEMYKGFDEVLGALPSLKAEFPDVVYLIAGDGDDRERLQQKARHLGVASLAIFTGHVVQQEKADHYRLADLYVMPSTGEGFGIVLLEALACGLPVIASGEDGGRDALRDGAYGRLINPSDRESLIAAVGRSLSASQEPKFPEAFNYKNFADAVGRMITLCHPAKAKRVRRDSPTCVNT